MGIEPATLWFADWHSIHWSTLARAAFMVLNLSFRTSLFTNSWKVLGAGRKLSLPLIKEKVLVLKINSCKRTSVSNFSHLSVSFLLFVLPPSPNKNIQYVGIHTHKIYTQRHRGVPILHICITLLWNSLSLPWLLESLGPVLSFLPSRKRLLETLILLQSQIVLCWIAKDPF